MGGSLQTWSRAPCVGKGELQGVESQHFKVPGLVRKGKAHSSLLLICFLVSWEGTDHREGSSKQLLLVISYTCCPADSETDEQWQMGLCVCAHAWESVGWSHTLPALSILITIMWKAGHKEMQRKGSPIPDLDGPVGWLCMQQCSLCHEQPVSENAGTFCREEGMCSTIFQGFSLICVRLR